MEHDRVDSANGPKAPRYPIGAVVRLTGISAHVLRMWERRHGVVIPTRTAGNHRLYSEEDVERLRLLERAREMGYSIGFIAGLSFDELRSLVDVRNEENAELPSVTEGSPETWLDACKNATYTLDFRTIRETLLRAHAAVSPAVLLEHVVTPLMEWVGDEWSAGRIRVAQEHLLAAAVRTFLATLIVTRRGAPQTATIVVSTPAGQHHEIGALLAASVACEEGWKVVYVGPDLPASEIAGATSGVNARAVALSIIYPSDDPMIVQELETLRTSLSPETAIIVGGRGSHGYQAVLDRVNAVRLTDMGAFRNLLRQMRDSGPIHSPA